MPHTDSKKRREWYLAYYERNKDRIKAHNKAYYWKNRGKKLAWQKEYAKTHPTPLDKQRGYNLKFSYGINIEQYNKLLVEQNGVCAICGDPPLGVGKHQKVLHVDHDHTTQEVRGLLCDRCNKAVGLMRDRADLFLAAATYCEAFR